VDKFANLATKEKQLYFEKTAAAKGLPSEMIEKDFWVCWILKKLFSLNEINNELLFKGGTSLSKVYNLIERFSEDIDITISRSYLGFIDGYTPEHASSNKKREAILKDILFACRNFVNNRLKKYLEDIVRNDLPEIAHQCSIQSDINDPDKQTLLFYYPTQSEIVYKQYVSPYVRIELGARGGYWPILEKTIKPMVFEEMQLALNEANIPIRVLDAKRSFWEKAIILHKYSHYPVAKVVPQRQSRHYYDFYQLIKSDIRTQAEHV